MTLPTMQPRTGPLFVVRWLRADGRNTKHSYFRREHDARAFLHRMRDYGKEAALYRCHVSSWQEVDE